MPACFSQPPFSSEDTLHLLSPVLIVMFRHGRTEGPLSRASGGGEARENFTFTVSLNEWNYTYRSLKLKHISNHHELTEETFRQVLGSSYAPPSLGSLARLDFLSLMKDNQSLFHLLLLFSPPAQGLTVGG